MLRVFDAVTGTDDTRSLSGGGFPPLNVTQDNDNFYVHAEVPGMKPSDLSVSALRNRVTVSGKREIREENGGSSYHRKERAEGEFNRTITLPTEVAVDKIEARCVDGILTLTLPKVEETKPRKIAVRT